MTNLTDKFNHLETLTAQQTQNVLSAIAALSTGISTKLDDQGVQLAQQHAELKNRVDNIISLLGPGSQIISLLSSIKSDLDNVKSSTQTTAERLGEIKNRLDSILSVFDPQNYLFVTLGQIRDNTSCLCGDDPSNPPIDDPNGCTNPSSTASQVVSGGRSYGVWTYGAPSGTVIYNYEGIAYGTVLNTTGDWEGYSIYVKSASRSVFKMYLNDDRVYSTNQWLQMPSGDYLIAPSVEGETPITTLLCVPSSQNRICFTLTSTYVSIAPRSSPTKPGADMIVVPDLYPRDSNITVPPYPPFSFGDSTVWLGDFTGYSIKNTGSFESIFVVRISTDGQNAIVDQLSPNEETTIATATSQIWITRGTTPGEPDGAFSVRICRPAS